MSKELEGPIKVLFVDDEPDMQDMMRQRMRRRVRRGDIDIEYAASGVEALNTLADRYDTRIVFTDINMPEMDGLALLERIKGGEASKDIRTIVVSAYGDMSNIRRAMNAGAYDFVTKPVDFDDLNAVLDKVTAEVTRDEHARHTEAHLGALKEEMDYAGRLQARILPTDFPDDPRCQIFASTKAAKDVGGDFYDIFPVDKDHLGFLIADVSGKGIAAAIFMAISRTIINVIAQSAEEGGFSPANVLGHANRLICRENPEMFFVTLMCGRVDMHTGEVIYANAGHMPPILIGADGRVGELPLTQESMAVGVHEALEFHNETAIIQPGDALYMYTDGVSEANDESGHVYGLERLLEILRAQGVGKNPRQLTAAVWDELEKFRGESGQYDDVTQLAVKYLGDKSG